MVKTFKAASQDITDPVLRVRRKATSDGGDEPPFDEGPGKPIPTRFERMDREPYPEETRKAAERMGELREFLEAAYHKPDWDAFEMALVAALVHCYFVDYPIWFFIVGPPSSLKTTILEGLSGLQKTFVEGSMTANTLLSGFSNSSKGKADLGYSLLGRIGREGIVTFPEFGAFMANEKVASQISSDLRMVHDGHFTKSAGSLKEQLEWKGKLTVIAAMTEKMEWLWSKDAGMGDRFITIRYLVSDDPHAVGQAAVGNQSKQASNRETLQGFFARLIEAQYGLPVGQLGPRPKEIQDRLIGLAVLVAELRRACQEDRKAEEVYRAYSREGTGRLALMFCQLADGRASLYRRKLVDEGDLHLVQRAALDSIPWERHAIVMEMPPEGMGVDVKDLWPKLQKKHGMTSKGQMRMALRELEAFGLIDIKEDDQGESLWASEVRWSKQGQELLERAGLNKKRIREVEGEKGQVSRATDEGVSRG